MLRSGIAVLLIISLVSQSGGPLITDCTASSYHEVNMFCFSRNCYTAFHSGYANFHSYMHSTSSPLRSVICFIDLYHSTWCHMKYQRILICISLKIKDVQQFKCILQSSYFIFKSPLFSSIPILTGLFFFLLPAFFEFFIYFRY